MFFFVSYVSLCCVSLFNPLHMRLYFIRSRSRQQIMKSCVLHVCIKNFYNSTQAKAFKFIIGPRKVMRLRFVCTHISRLPRYVVCFPLPEASGQPDAQLGESNAKLIARCISTDTAVERRRSASAGKHELVGRKLHF